MNQRTGEIEYIGHLGDGVAHLGEELIRLPMASPGDKIGQSGDGAWIVVEEGPNRAPPSCNHFGVCGGCNLQHVSLPHYLRAKEKWVREALGRQGLDGVAVQQITQLEPKTRRRAAFSLGWHGTTPIVGFHEIRSDRVVPLAICTVLVPEIVDCLPALRNLSARWLNPGQSARFSVTAYSSGLDIDLEVEEAVSRDLKIDQHEIDLLRQAGVARFGVNGEVRVSFHPVHVDLSGVAVAPGISTFLQATKLSETRLVDAVVEIIGDAAAVADLYAGLGTFTFALARHCAVTAFEGHADATSALCVAAEDAGLDRVRGVARDLVRRPLTSKELNKFDAVVIDPPRQGAEPQVKTLARSTVPRIAYVSCNPQSFARDARLLVEGGYELRSVLPVDQFLWSSHVELVAHFERAKTKKKRPFHPRQRRRV